MPLSLKAVEERHVMKLGADEIVQVIVVVLVEKRRSWGIFVKAWVIRSWYEKNVRTLKQSLQMIDDSVPKNPVIHVTKNNDGCIQ